MINFDDIKGFVDRTETYVSTRKMMEQEARECIIEALDGYFDDYYCDLHDEVFNRDLYVVYTYDAEQLLDAYGVFNAIKKVVDYEKDYIGEVCTDISDPVKLANMLWYVTGFEVMWDVTNIAYFKLKCEDEIACKETNAAIISELKKLSKWKNCFAESNYTEPSEEDFFAICG